MKTLLLIFTLALTLGSCSKNEMEFKVATEYHKKIDIGDKAAKFPGVHSKLKSIFWDSVAVDHPLCVSAEMDRMVDKYLIGCGEYTPNVADIKMSFPHKTDTLTITFRGVITKFYTDGGTDWNGEYWPIDPLSGTVFDKSYVPVK